MSQRYRLDPDLANALNLTDQEKLFLQRTGGEGVLAGVNQGQFLTFNSEKAHKMQHPGFSVEHAGSLCIVKIRPYS